MLFESLASSTMGLLCWPNLRMLEPRYQPPEGCTSDFGCTSDLVSLYAYRTVHSYSVSVERAHLPRSVPMDPWPRCHVLVSRTPARGVIRHPSSRFGVTYTMHTQTLSEHSEGDIWNPKTNISQSPNISAYVRFSAYSA